MSTLDAVLTRVRQLPPERQDAIAAQIDWLLDDASRESVFSEEEWSAIEPTLDADQAEIPHAEIVSELKAKFPAKLSG